jgi:apolipoprotein N-acyltransferase
MPRHIRGALLANFNFLSDVTFYTRFGDWIAWICAAITLLLLVLGSLRSRRSGAAQ